MRILAVTQPNSGVGYHRMMLPLRYLDGAYVLFTDFINDEVLSRQFDIVTFNRFIPGVELETLLAYRNKYGFKIVMDVDDYWELDGWHILKPHFPTQTIIDHLQAADIVIATHDRLLKEVRRYNTNWERIPNALPFDQDQFTSHRVSVDEMNANLERPIIPGSIRFLYAGGITHRRDLELMAIPMRNLASEDRYKDRAHFIMAGYDTSNPQVIPVWNSMVKSYTGNARLNFHLRGPLMPDKYMAFYSEADVAFAPLIESKFNSLKSNIKALEAGCKRIPLIASDVFPYKDIPCIIPVEARRDWVKSIKRCIDSDYYREDKGEQLGEWVRKNFHLAHWNRHRKQIYEWIIKK